MVIHKSGPRPDLAHKFINFMLDGKNSAELSNMLGSGNPNMAALPYIDEIVRDNRSVFPDESGWKKLQALRDLPRKERRLMNRLWTEIKVR
jgi:spermidine/putrescine transport system substrate-binding protein